MHTELTISKVGAVKRFLEENSVRGKITLREMTEFWNVLTEDEKLEFSASAAQQLGLTLKE